MKSKFKIISYISLILAIIITVLLVYKAINIKDNSQSLDVNLSNLTYNGNNSLKVYNQEDFNTFLMDYNNKKLPSVYVTKFLFDGVEMYKPYDLDDFISNGNDYQVTALDATVLNINTVGNVSLSGELTGGMLAIDTNNLVGDINILLNNVKIDTDSKKIPVMYVYNKDITYTKAVVTINALKGTKNYLEGGKLKKVSLMDSDNLSNYTNKYTGDNLSNYQKYTNYYGVYTSSDINNILFATVAADNEDLADGDPASYYKASGAISSDIDLYFKGEGYLEVTSKNKEGIETKGNLSFTGGSGDYIVNSMDDCLNTTTDSKENNNARNTLTIDVNSLYAIVSNESDEGDAIDSNGELIINGGTILAVAKPGGDAGIDSERGTYINGGVVYATGDMYDEIKSDSKQAFMVFSFQDKPNENDIITLLDENNNVVFSYKTDRSFTNLIYSSSVLVNGNYTLYKNGTITGEDNNGIYSNISNYNKGDILGYTANNINGGMPGGMEPGNNLDGNRMENGERPSNNDGTRPDVPNQRPDDHNIPPEKPSGDNTMAPTDNSLENDINTSFTVNGITNIFGGIRVNK